MSRSRKKHPYMQYINNDESLKADKQINNRMARRKNKQIDYEDEDYEVENNKTVRDRYNWDDDDTKHYIKNNEDKIKYTRK